MHTGIDPGLTVTAVVTLDDNGKVICKDHFGSGYNDAMKFVPKDRPSERYRLYHDRLIRYFRENQVTGTVVLENTIGNVVGNGRKLIELQGVYVVALSFVIPSHNLFLPAPTTIKRAFTGNGAASKDDMIKQCKKRGILPRHDHEADAVAMAFMSIEGKLGK